MSQIPVRFKTELVSDFAKNREISGSSAPPNTTRASMFRSLISIVVRRERKPMPRRYVDDLITESEPRDARRFWPDSIARPQHPLATYSRIPPAGTLGCATAIREDTHPSISLLRSFPLFLSAAFYYLPNLRIRRSIVIPVSR